MTDPIVLFKSGLDGYNTYRIPALLMLGNGRLLAFCEARRDTCEDYGKIDIVLRMSDDNGKTFTPQCVIAQYGNDTIGNPCPVFDRETGRVWLFLNTNLAQGTEYEINLNKAPREVGEIHSDDFGRTWSPFHNLTKTLKRPGWTWYATGPCHAIQLESGRLVIPCNHGVFDSELGDTRVYQPHVIISDDHGATWRIGGTVDSCGNETTIETLSDGRIYLNARNMYNNNKYRIVSLSDDGGETWAPAHEETQLPDPMCQASVIAYPKAVEGCTRPLLFVNNPNVPSKKRGEARRDLSVRISLDDGNTWSGGLRLLNGRTAYSDLAVLPDGNVACMYECGAAGPYERIEFKCMSVEEIMREGEAVE